ncbi:MAG TPA: hypothetical protein VFI70_03480 [Nitrososphaeraceae archaeon]|nr:hypothetical protein [Nitrososphaeraceae archaeon]
MVDRKRVNAPHNLSEKQNVMDDITNGQWSKNHYNDDDYDYHDRDYMHEGDILDPYTMQKSFRKTANKLSRRL